MELSRILNTHVAPLPVAYECEVYTTLPESPVVSDNESGLRAGKWTDEEERFTLELIKHFLAGALTAPTGISLRAFLARQLRCSPMRISTKLAMDILGGERITKRLGQKRYFPLDTVDSAERRRIAQVLYELEVAFLDKENIGIRTAFHGGEHGNAHTSDDESVDDNNAAVRVGSWSDEEQIYAAALIDGFLRGHLDLDHGTTLRAFLAERLCCNPMRISKKLTTGMMGNQALPKRLGFATFHPARDISRVQVTHTAQELARLREACFAPAHGTTSASSRSDDECYVQSGRDTPYHCSSLSPINPSNKKGFFSQTQPVLPSLMDVCKKSRYPSMDDIDSYY